MNIIVLGDSIAWGAFDHSKGGWVERLKTHLFDYECFVYNCSISGNTSNDILKRMNSEIECRKDDIDGTGIIIAIGANDCGFGNGGKKEISEEQYQTNIRKIYHRAKKITDNILFVGLTPIDDKKTNPVAWDSNLNYSHSVTKQYNYILEIFCSARDISFCSLIDLKTKSFSDGCHPDEETHNEISFRVSNKIEDWYK